MPVLAIRQVKIDPVAVVAYPLGVLQLTYEDWLRLDEIEVSKGRAQGRLRVKFTKVEEMLAAIGIRASAAPD